MQTASTQLKIARIALAVTYCHWLPSTATKKTSLKTDLNLAKSNTHLQLTCFSTPVFSVFLYPGHGSPKFTTNAATGDYTKTNFIGSAKVVSVRSTRVSSPLPFIRTYSHLIPSRTALKIKCRRPELSQPSQPSTMNPAIAPVVNGNQANGNRFIAHFRDPSTTTNLDTKQLSWYRNTVSRPSPKVLLLIPAYNEERRIEPVLRDYAKYFRDNHQGEFEICVVTNGCRDNTIGVVKRVQADFPNVELVDFPAPIGKGGALIEGLRLAPKADLIGYVDADGATGPKAFDDLVKHAGEADCIIGSRWIKGAILHQSQTGQRQFASRVFHAIVQSLFWMNIRDTQCGAKVLHREVVEKIHSSLCIADMAFDINLLYLVKRAGFKTLEVPTEWTDKAGSKVALGRTSLTMLLSVIRLRWIYSPFAFLRKIFQPIENWAYRKLNAPPPAPDPKKGDVASGVKSPT